MFYPRSVFRLTVMALLVVVLPLCAALVAVVLSVEKQADSGQKAVIEAMAATRSSRDLVQRLGLVMRQAQRYAVVGEPQLLDTYLTARAGLDQALTRLRSSLPDSAEGELLDELIEREQQMYNKMAQFSAHAPNPLADGDLAMLSSLGKELVAATEQRVGQRLEAMETGANEAGREWLWPVLLVVPVVGLLALISTLMVVRPIRRMEEAVKDLGEGQFETPIVINGPGDIARLGEKLDWLRLRLRELEQEKARFLRHISHELKTPLTAIRESAELMADGTLGPLPPSQREVADITRENAVKLQGLIEGLLNFNMRSVGRDTDTRAALDLDRLVARVVASHRPVLARKHLKLHENLHPARIQGDEDGLVVVLENLLSNAVKYSPIGGTLDIGLVSDGRRIVLDVRDQGPGFNEYDRKRVFEAFFQGRPPAGESVPGTGLGLAIAAEHVKAHGGELSIVDSTDWGAHLRAVLPAMAGSELPTAATDTTDVTPAEQPARWRKRETTVKQETRPKP